MHEPSSTTPPSADPGTPATNSPIEDDAVAEAVRELDSLDNAPVHEHPAVIDQVHRALQDRLSEPGAR